MRGEGARGELGLRRCWEKWATPVGLTGRGRDGPSPSGESASEGWSSKWSTRPSSTPPIMRVQYTNLRQSSRGLRRRDRTLQAEERAEHLVGSIVDEVRLRMRRGARAALDEGRESAPRRESKIERVRPTGPPPTMITGTSASPVVAVDAGGGARCRAGGREERRHAARAFGRPGDHEGRGERAPRTTRARHGDHGARRRRRPRHLRARYAPSPPRQVTRESRSS